jgi:hypothetical protein
MRGPEGGRIVTVTIARAPTAPRIGERGPRFDGGIPSGPRKSLSRVVGATPVPHLAARIPMVDIGLRMAQAQTGGLRAGRLEGIKVIPQVGTRPVEGNTQYNRDSLPSRVPVQRRLPEMRAFELHPDAALPRDIVRRISPRELQRMLRQSTSESRVGNMRDRSVRIVDMPPRDYRRIAPVNSEFRTPEVVAQRTPTVRSEIKRVKTELKKIETKKVTPEPVQTPTMDLRLSPDALQTIQEVKPETSGARFGALLRKKVNESVRTGSERKKEKTPKVKVENNDQNTDSQRFINIYSYSYISGHWDDKTIIRIQNLKNPLPEIKNAIRALTGRVKESPSQRKLQLSDVVSDTARNLAKNPEIARRDSADLLAWTYLSEEKEKKKDLQARLAITPQATEVPIPSGDSIFDPIPPNGGGGGGGGSREFQMTPALGESQSTRIPKGEFVRDEIPDDAAEKKKKLPPVNGYPEFFKDYDTTIDHHPIMHFKIDEPVQRRRLDEWAHAVRMVFTLSMFAEVKPLSLVVLSLPKITTSTESTLVSQLNGRRDGSNMEWRRELFFSQIMVTMSQAYSAGMQTIRRMPAVILDLMGIDARGEDVMRVMNGDRVSENALPA